MRSNFLLILPTILTVAAGCHNIRRLVFVTGTTIGIEATAEEGPEQHLIVGVKRFEGALIPTVYAPAGDWSKIKVRDKAYSVFAGLGFKTGFLGADTRIFQVFGTGKAALALAGSSTGLSNIALSIRNERPQPSEASRAAIGMLGGVHRIVAALAQGSPRRDPDPAAKLILDELAAFGARVIPTLKPFPVFDWNGPLSTLEIKKTFPDGHQPFLDETDGFLKLLQYVNHISLSKRAIENLRRAAKKLNKTLDEFDFKTPHIDRDGLADAIKWFETNEPVLHLEIAQSTAVRNAMKYFIDQVTD